MSTEEIFRSEEPSTEEKIAHLAEIVTEITGIIEAISKGEDISFNLVLGKHSPDGKSTHFFSASHVSMREYASFIDGFMERAPNEALVLASLRRRASEMTAAEDGDTGCDNPDCPACNPVEETVDRTNFVPPVEGEENVH